MFSEISLDDVAARRASASRPCCATSAAGRRSSSRSLDVRHRPRSRDERAAPVGDVDTALAVLVEHYERRGDSVVLMLAQEGTDETVRRFTENGRRMHRDWVRTIFALPSPPRARSSLDLLAVATDVYTWKLQALR